MIAIVKSFFWGAIASLFGQANAIGVIKAEGPALSRTRTSGSNSASVVEADRRHAFYGRHLIASYTDCDAAALRDLQGLRRAIHEAVSASGATELRCAEQVFPPDGFTMIVLLSESHASIHTYPEYDSCFVDLFTCGYTCIVERFDEVLRAYLNPRHSDCRISIRDRGERLVSDAVTHHSGAGRAPSLSDGRAPAGSVFE
jgi:S-adenosylmethionine decarboxylase